MRSFKLFGDSACWVDDLDLISRSQGCLKGKAASCVFSISYCHVKFKLCSLYHRECAISKRGDHVPNAFHEWHQVKGHNWHMSNVDRHLNSGFFSQMIFTWCFSNFTWALHFHTSFGDLGQKARSLWCWKDEKLCLALLGSTCKTKKTKLSSSVMIRTEWKLTNDCMNLCKRMWHDYCYYFY